MKNHYAIVYANGARYQVFVGSHMEYYYSYKAQSPPPPRMKK